MVEVAPELGIGTLTLFAFSSDNWNRPAAEVSTLMGLCRRYLRQEREECIRNGVRVSVIGRRDRLAESLVRAIEDVERATSHCSRIRLRIALDYSARDALVAASSRLWRSGLEPSRESFAGALGQAIHDSEPVAGVDLLIRTGAEQRLSDFMLWECAYAEILFSKRLWPDFGKSDLVEAVGEFRKRDRRFGAVSSTVLAAKRLTKVRSA